MLVSFLSPAELYAQIDARILAIAVECEALCDALPQTAREDFPKIDEQIAELTAEHNCLIPHWRALDWLLNQERLELERRP